MRGLRCACWDVDTTKEEEEEEEEEKKRNADTSKIALGQQVREEVDFVLTLVLVDFGFV